MSTNRGIFESFLNKQAAGADKPFAAVPESSASAASPRQESPFSADSPFQIAEPAENYGFEAPTKTFYSSPFETVPAAASTSDSPSPFFTQPQPDQSPQTSQPSSVSSPFAVEQARNSSASTPAAIPAFNTWQKTPATALPAEAVSAQEPTAQAFPSSLPASSSVPPESTPTPAVPAAQVPLAADPVSPLADLSHSDSSSIRQLELRAIFGMDREMDQEEILQRSRALPGLKNIVLVSPQEMGIIDSFRNLLPNLGFGSGGLKLYAGSVPLEFIREGSVMLAVQTSGGFAPGVRETLILVARELGRIS